MKTLVLTAAMTLAAIGVRAETIALTDPLSQIILRKAVAEQNGGVRGVVAVKGATIPLELGAPAEAKAAPAKLAAAADPRDLALKTAPPLTAPKAAKKAKGKAPKAAKEQLRHVAAPGKGWR